MSNKISLLFLLVVCFTAFISALPQRGKDCGENQEYTTCGSACPRRCNQSEGPQVCTLQCIIGCQCKREYLLSKSGECVKPEDC